MFSKPPKEEFHAVYLNMDRVRPIEARVLLRLFYVM